MKRIVFFLLLIPCFAGAQVSSDVNDTSGNNKAVPITRMDRIVLNKIRDSINAAEQRKANGRMDSIGNSYQVRFAAKLRMDSTAAGKRIDSIQLLPGPQGVAGSIGSTGAKGDKGDTGPQGIQGVAGAQGAKGDIGLTGPTGAQGIQGTTGATGPQGIQGAKGDVGATGPQGPIGLTGATGPAGTNGTNGTNALVTLTTTGATGVATYNAGTGALNIPNYSSNYAVNAATVGLSKATLNSTYPTSPVGFMVFCPSITLGGAIYIRVTTGASGTWQAISAPPAL